MVKDNIIFVLSEAVNNVFLEDDEILNVQKQVESFLKFLNSEQDNIKKLEEENS